MGKIPENWRVPAAALFSVVLITGAYMLARSVESPPAAQASTETALLQAIAKKDSDNDGLPDWEEALYGTSSNNPDSFSLGMTDGEAVAKGLVVPKVIANIQVATSSPNGSSDFDSSLPSPAAEGTLTAAFAENFFSLYLATKEAKGGGDLSESELSNISDQALNSLSSAVIAAPDFKSMRNLTVSGSGPDALKAFAASAEAVLLKNTSAATKSEVLYLQDLVEKNDPTALAYITALAKVYRDSAAGLAVLPVPTELAADYLSLINAMARVSETTTDFARVETDPLATILALKQYPDAVLALGTAFINIGNIYKKGGIFLSTGAPGASFVNMIADIETQQQVTTPTL
ncbi:MAG: thrombospondin type 3 repeat-containing protein [bacterium]|nr:thrombospondin type 3 repeat-containing protein [bacterium]